MDYEEGVTLNKIKIENQILQLLQKEMKVLPPILSSSASFSSSSTSSSLSSSTTSSTLTNLPTKFPFKLVVFVLAGSFNPPHLGHVASFLAAKKAVEKAGDCYRVVGGFFQPSSDSYVYQKLFHEAMSLKHRNKLCELISQHTDWIDTCPWGWASGIHATKQIEFVLQKWISSHSIFGQIIPEDKLQCVFLAGADLAIRMSLWQRDNLSVCLARKGSTERVRKSLKEWNANKNKSKLNDKKRKEEKNGMRAFVLVEDEELIDLSSTEIREKLNSLAYRDMVDKGWITSVVADYLEEKKQMF